MKTEIIDPSYGATAAQMNGNPMLDKVKNSYTRKPPAEAGPKTKRVKKEPVDPTNGGQSVIGDHMPVQKKKRDRFKGTTEEEVLTRVLPDHVKEDLDILIVSTFMCLSEADMHSGRVEPAGERLLVAQRLVSLVSATTS